MRKHPITVMYSVDIVWPQPSDRDHGTRATTVFTSPAGDSFIGCCDRQKNGALSTHCLLLECPLCVLCFFCSCFNQRQLSLLAAVKGWVRFLWGTYWSSRGTCLRCSPSSQLSLSWLVCAFIRTALVGGYSVLTVGSCASWMA